MFPKGYTLTVVPPDGMHVEAEEMQDNEISLPAIEPQGELTFDMFIHAELPANADTKIEKKVKNYVFLNNTLAHFKDVFPKLRHLCT